MFATVGGQLAQYLDRRRREQAESRRLHAQLDRTRGFLDAAGALIVVLDREGRVLLANARACAASGLEEPEMIGRDWFSLAVPEGRPARPRAPRSSSSSTRRGRRARPPPALRRGPAPGRRLARHALDDDGGVLLLGHAEVVARRAAIAAAGCDGSRAAAA